MRLILDEDKQRIEEALRCVSTPEYTVEYVCRAQILLERVLANMHQLERAASTMKPEA